MKKIRSRWMHDGKEYEVIEGDCDNCDFNRKPYCALKFAETCFKKLGNNKYFKLKESKHDQAV